MTAEDLTVADGVESFPYIKHVNNHRNQPVSHNFYSTLEHIITVRRANPVTKAACKLTKAITKSTVIQM